MAQAKSQNGWPVIPHGQCRKWIIPVKKGPSRHFVLQPGNAGFILAHFALWYHERIEPINQEAVWDDWGWADRPIRGSTVISNHASGTAIDLNAVAHPLGKKGTLKFPVTVGRLRWKNGNRVLAVQRVRMRLRNFYKGVIRAGFDYQGRVDEMHYEINSPPGTLGGIARKLAKTPRGKRVLKANPGFKVI